MNISILPAFSGLIDSIVSAVLRVILTPIMELVAWLLETILGPILETILVPVMDFAVDLVMTTMSGVFYTMLKQVLTVLDTIEKSFQIFAGVAPVKYNGAETDLLNVFVLQNSDLTRAFWLLTFLCLVLCCIFTIYGTTRSTFDFDFENKRPVGKVLGAAGKTCITFLLIPLFVVFTILLTSIVMKEVYRVTNVANLSVADTVFQISAMSANKDPAHNLSTSETFTSGMRNQFNGGGWKNIDNVREKFDVAKIDYVLGFGLSFFMVFIMATISFVFVQRMFEIMLLYLAAPFFVSTMPLDDGQKYNGWRDMFIAKMIAGMGTLVMMNLYLMAVTVIMSPDIVLDVRTIQGGAVGSEYLSYDYLVKMVFVAGGALAVKQGAALITGLVNYQAGMQEQTMMASTSAMVRRAGGFAMGAAYGVVKTTAKVGVLPARGAWWGTRYAMTNKRMHGDPSSKMTRALTKGHDAKEGVKDVAGKTSSLLHGDIGGMFKKNGEDTYESKRAAAFQNRDFSKFFQLKDDKLKEEREAPIRKARAEEDDKNRAFVTAMRERAEQQASAPRGIGERAEQQASAPGGIGERPGLQSAHTKANDWDFGGDSIESDDSASQSPELDIKLPKAAAESRQQFTEALAERDGFDASTLQSARVDDDEHQGGGSSNSPPPNHARPPVQPVVSEIDTLRFRSPVQPPTSGNAVGQPNEIGAQPASSGAAQGRAGYRSPVQPPASGSAAGQSNAAPSQSASGGGANAAGGTRTTGVQQPPTPQPPKSAQTPKPQPPKPPAPPQPSKSAGTAKPPSDKPPRGPGNGGSDMHFR